MKIDVTFRNEYQKDFFWHRERNGLFDGGFGNGKTYAAMERAAVHLMNFNMVWLFVVKNLRRLKPLP
jgi:hypothetical protein